jgi:glutamate/tyrosine decarboxylase-like PLP-dependent enzyme
MNIVNFRYLDESLDDDKLDDLNAEILMQLHERGIATPSSTVLNSRFSIRVAICNHRSKRADFEALVDSVVAIGADIGAS